MNSNSRSTMDDPDSFSYNQFDSQSQSTYNQPSSYQGYVPTSNNFPPTNSSSINNLDESFANNLPMDAGQPYSNNLSQATQHMPQQIQPQSQPLLPQQQLFPQYQPQVQQQAHFNSDFNVAPNYYQQFSTPSSEIPPQIDSTGISSSIPIAGQQIENDNIFESHTSGSSMTTQFPPSATTPQNHTPASKYDNFRHTPHQIPVHQQQQMYPQHSYPESSYSSSRRDSFSTSNPNFGYGMDQSIPPTPHQPQRLSLPVGAKSNYSGTPSVYESSSTPYYSYSSAPTSATYLSMPSKSRQSGKLKHVEVKQDNDDTLTAFYPRASYRIVRGISAGGSSTRPPKESLESDSVFLPVELSINGASMEDICKPKWNPSEKSDRRRIIRIERVQNGPNVIAHFNILGSAEDNPEALDSKNSNSNSKVVEVSCLECDVYPKFKGEAPENESATSSSEDEYYSGQMNNDNNGGKAFQYYITSVEVIEIVELLIGQNFKDPAERRRERGRVRSNLVPFWSKKPISSRMSDSHAAGESALQNRIQIAASYPPYRTPSNHECRVELAKRIMGYETRKPRGFDKEVRILRWDKLVPALRRALQSYYAEIPQADAMNHF
ncbi:uncharacterized protein KQ657_003323 [Scheffersomyces spartinae]|uniref:DUF7082 domain-containing protein n=1 Tax=Scheffersomyces spartinae TaxID=45513 RepID=A0A9P8AK59_9ASCO|nr:uncharacterized protein KQ657_003323 [Scheffersomyces spartinae]KAG7195556.1 hypothetical protein KQ657_003323 [Scheffersomyces spartinae]